MCAHWISSPILPPSLFRSLPCSLFGSFRQDQVLRSLQSRAATSHKPLLCLWLMEDMSWVCSFFCCIALSHSHTKWIWPHRLYTHSLSRMWGNKFPGNRRVWHSARASAHLPTLNGWFGRCVWHVVNRRRCAPPLHGRGQPDSRSTTIFCIAPQPQCTTVRDFLFD